MKKVLIVVDMQYDFITGALGTTEVSVKLHPKVTASLKVTVKEA